MLAERLKESFPDQIHLYGIESLKDELEGLISDGETYPKFDDFARRYSISNGRDLLLKFYKIADALYALKSIPESFIGKLLPDQTGVVGPLQQSWSDGGSFQLKIEDHVNPIPTELKDIASKIGLNIRGELIDPEFAQLGIVRGFVHETSSAETVLKEITSQTRYGIQKKLESWDEKSLGWIELFRWCVYNHKLERNFQIVTKGKDLHVLTDTAEEALIPPFDSIGIPKEFEEIYPDARILNSKYFDVEEPGRTSLLKALVGYRAFVVYFPVHWREMNINSEKLDSILEQGLTATKSEHRIQADGEAISHLPFWNEVIGRVSEVDSRAGLLFRFVIEYLAARDLSWEQFIDVSCICRDKKHRVRPSLWFAGVKIDSWVPVKVIENGKEQIVRKLATPEAIKALFSADQFDKIVAKSPDTALRLLPHLGFDALDIQIKLHSMKTGQEEAAVRGEMSNLVAVVGAINTTELVHLVMHDPSGFAGVMAEARQKVWNKEIKEENEEVGRNVELLIKKIIRDLGVTVTSIYVGGDLEVWPQEREGFDYGAMALGPATLEVKSTSSTRVHLSRAQSETASSSKENYFILVVEDKGELRRLLIKGFDEKTPPHELLDMVSDNTYVLKDIYLKLGQAPNPDEVEADIHGYWIKRKLWDGSVSLRDWLAEKFAVLAASAAMFADSDEANHAQNH